jgi:proton-translocating NAD(P)+ transhydrogenase subunit alpha
MSGNQVFDIYIFVLAAFIGFQVISRVPSILHTPLMSGTNAIHGIILVGAIALASSAQGWLSITIAVLAVFLGTINVVGGFVVTDRILHMFARPPSTQPHDPEGARYE